MPPRHALPLPEITALGDTMRRGDDGGYWIDGVCEGRVRDRHLEELAPDWRRVPRHGLARAEVPTQWRLQVRDPELVRALTELVRDYATIGSIHDEGATAAVGARGHFRSEYRVPIRAWQLIMEPPCGATWHPPTTPTSGAAPPARAARDGYPPSGERARQITRSVATLTRSRPRDFARYMARSARCSSSSRVRLSRG